MKVTAKDLWGTKSSYNEKIQSKLSDRGKLHSMRHFLPTQRSYAPSSNPIRNQQESKKSIEIATNIIQPIWDHYSKLGLLVIWSGLNQPIQSIIEWWEAKFTNQVSISTLYNNFLFIFCKKEEVKKEILYKNIKFFKGHYFHCIEWIPNFNSNTFRPTQFLKWVDLGSMQVEYQFLKILEVIKWDLFLVVRAYLGKTKRKLSKFS